MGSIKKAKHYHERAIRGKSENEQSIVRQTAIQIIVANRDRTYEESKTRVGAGFERIPSPSGFCTGMANNQISLLPYFTEAQAYAIDNYSEAKKSERKQNNFTTPELLHMNNLPVELERLQ